MDAPKTDKRLLMASAGMLTLAFLVAIWFPYRAGAGRPYQKAADTRTGIQGVAEDAVSTPSDSTTSLSQSAGAVSSPPLEPATPNAAVGEAGRDASPEPAGNPYGGTFVIEDIKSAQEGVLSTTLDLWNSEYFKSITLAEAREALGRDIPVDLSGDGLLLDRIGGLPTEEDALRGLDSPRVQEALYKFLVADGISLEFELNPIRTPEMERALENALRARDSAQDGLYAALDEASGYHNWKLLGAVWREMDKE